MNCPECKPVPKSVPEHRDAEAASVLSERMAPGGFA